MLVPIPGFAENPDNWIFLWIYAILAVLSGRKFLQAAILGYIFIYVQIIHYNIIPYMYLTNVGKNLSHKRCSTITVWKCFPDGPSRSGYLAFRITSIRISGVLPYTEIVEHAEMCISCCIRQSIGVLKNVCVIKGHKTLNYATQVS